VGRHKATERPIHDADALATGRRRVSNKQQHSESGRKRNERKQHDQREKRYEEHTEMAWHQNKTMRYGMIALVVVAIAGITLLFMAGLIKW
jgi:hypothetical protein